jgi:hypothetical protein
MLDIDGFPKCTNPASIATPVGTVLRSMEIIAGCPIDKGRHVGHPKPEFHHMCNTATHTFASPSLKYVHPALLYGAFAKSICCIA